MTMPLTRGGVMPIPVPTTINHLVVMGAMPVQARHGERCHQWVVMCHDPERPAGRDYVTWRVGCDGPGDHYGAFVAFEGEYDLSEDRALRSMVKRAKFRPVREGEITEGEEALAAVLDMVARVRNSPDCEEITVEDVRELVPHSVFKLLCPFRVEGD
ncbi:hypothetical protein [Micromonospora sp. NPDC047730]|uniref:hypothetical protein n=1 Tax=Micromonospora sp. NPDC047730 TaxID=3364253 RepID=UPI00372444EB